MWPEILEILKYTLPAFIVLIATYLIVRNFMKSEIRRLEIRLKRETTKETLLLRLQAYERLIIFLERISPPNLFVRFEKDGLSAREFQQILIANIRAEYEHNLSQQIYVSREAWRLTTLAKDETIKVINLMAQAIPPDSTAMDLARDILKFYLETERQFPGEEAIIVIKEDVKQLL